MTIDSISICPATVQDIPDVVRLRRRMFEAMGCSGASRLDELDAACAAYFSRAIPSGEYRGWLAVTPEGEAVSAGGVVIHQHPPGPSNLCGRTGYIMNLYTAPAFRRRGLARCILELIMKHLRDQGLTTAALHATEIGRPLYSECGFEDGNEMRATL